MTPYEKPFTVTTSGSDQVVALDFPGRCTISRIAIVRVGTGSIVADVYNRAFTSTAQAIASIRDNGDGKCQIGLKASFGLSVGDVVTVAATGVGGYNTTHRVTERRDDKTYDTDVVFSVADYNAGTLTLAIPTAEQSLYKVTAQITGTSAAEASPDAVFHNQDPLKNLNIGVNRKLYFKFAAAATYRILVRAYENVAF